MKSKEILERIKKLKQSGKSIISNCYIPFSYDIDREWKVLCNDNAIAIIHFEGGVERLYYYIIDYIYLKELIDEYDGNPVIEVVSLKKNDADVGMEMMGYRPLKRLLRVANNNINVACIDDVKECDIGDILALTDDAYEIYNLLQNTFDTRISHLPEMDEIIKAINNNEFYICRNSKGIIVSLLQIKIAPRKYYVNQVINKGNKIVFHNMVKKTLNKYCKGGGKYAYAWVEEDNTASLKFFEKYGMIHDGMWNTIYIDNDKIDELG